MKNKILQVYDPPMCCSSGVCDPKDDTKLVQFASNLDWLQKQGIDIERYNLSSDPAAFAENSLVSALLIQGGNKCLPLILVEGAVVIRGIYPSRKELAGFTGIEYAENTSEQNTETSCGPGCDCAKPPADNKIKIITGLIIILIATGIFAYKLVNPRNIQKSKNINTSTAYKDYPNTMPLPVKQEKVTPKQANVISSATDKTAEKVCVGEYLDSFQALNMVAMDKDAAFILVPSKEKEVVKHEIETAMVNAQNTLNPKGVKVGLYTLRITAPEYLSISEQGSLPVILIASKGRGIKMVPSGEISETKLLQAYVELSRASSCCPGGGSSNGSCK